MRFKVTITESSIKNDTSTNFNKLSDFITAYFGSKLITMVICSLYIAASFFYILLTSDSFVDLFASLLSSVIFCLFLITPVTMFIDFKNQSIFKNFKEYFCSVFDTDIIEYEMPEHIENSFHKISTSLNTKKLTEQISRTNNEDVKYASGTNYTVCTKDIKYSNSKLGQIESKLVFLRLRLQECDIYFMPDLIRIRSGRRFKSKFTNWRATEFDLTIDDSFYELGVDKYKKCDEFEYEQLSVSMNQLTLVTSYPTPKDAEVVGETWTYVNKNGERDKRFKDNPKLPRTLQGKLQLDIGREKFILLFSKNTNHEEFGQALIEHKNNIKALVK